MKINTVAHYIAQHFGTEWCIDTQIKCLDNGAQSRVFITTPIKPDCIGSTEDHENNENCKGYLKACDFLYTNEFQGDKNHYNLDLVLRSRKPIRSQLAPTRNDMQRKFIKPEEWEKILPEEEVTFFDSSPVSDISLPPKTIAVAMHGNLTVYSAQGTVYVMRHDSNDTVALNIDEYGFNGQANEGKIEIKGPLKTPHHWVDDIPSFMKGQTPERIINRIRHLPYYKQNSK